MHPIQRSKGTRTGWLLGALLAASLAVPGQCAVVLDFGLVGDIGNAPDTYGQGAVSYGFAIGLYEVTNDQYAAFLNAVAASDPNSLYNTFMGSTARGGIVRSGTDGSFTYSVKLNMGNKPVVYVSYFDTIRFANWIQNGQPTGAQTSATTEDGAYTMYGPTSTTGRNAGAVFWLPTEDEWYKAAYYQPASAGGDSDSYWEYPTGTNTTPTFAYANASGDVVNPAPNIANTDTAADWNGQNGNVTTVGSAGAKSYYGAYDMAGNVWEITETYSSGTDHVILGGSWAYPVSWTEGGFAAGYIVTDEGHFNDIGFRLASVPEPTGAMSVLIALGLALSLGRSRNAKLGRFSYRTSHA